eukprot:478008-Hanusia_phi.AAC.2
MTRTASLSNETRDLPGRAPQTLNCAAAGAAFRVSLRRRSDQIRRRVRPGRASRPGGAPGARHASTVW